MKRSNIFFKLQEQPNGYVLWKKIQVKALGENRISFKDEEYDINPIIQANFTNTKSTTKNMDNEYKRTVFNILKNLGFFSKKHVKGLKLARMRDVLYNLLKEIAKIRSPTLPSIENISDGIQGEGVKIIITFNIIDIYTRLQILLDLKLPGQTDSLTEASNLIDEVYRRGEVQNKQQNRNALNKFSIL